MGGDRDSVVDSIAEALDRLGVIERHRFRPTLDLAWPRIVTGFSIRSKQTVGLALVGIAVGTQGTAGLAFALAYMQMVTQLGLGSRVGPSASSRRTTAAARPSGRPSSSNRASWSRRWSRSR